MDLLLAILIMVGMMAGLAIYFIPSIVADAKKSTDTSLIALLNLFLGWTFFGWVGALLWAILGPKRDEPGFQDGMFIVFCKCGLKVGLSKKKRVAHCACGQKFEVSDNI